MNPHTHALFALLIALVLQRSGIFSWSLVLICVAVSVLIDLDHYVMHVRQASTRRFSVLSMWNTSMHTMQFAQRSVLHEPKGVFWMSVFLLLLSVFFPLLAFAAGVGLYSHMFLDFINEIPKKVVSWRWGPVYMKSTVLNFFVDGISIIGIFLMF